MKLTVHLLKHCRQTLFFSLSYLKTARFANIRQFDTVSYFSIKLNKKQAFTQQAEAKDNIVQSPNTPNKRENKSYIANVLFIATANLFI